MTLREIVDMLRETYTGAIGSEFLHISEVEQKRWLQTAPGGHARAAELRRRTNACGFLRA